MNIDDVLSQFIQRFNSHEHISRAELAEWLDALQKTNNLRNLALGQLADSVDEHSLALSRLKHEIFCIQYERDNPDGKPRRF